MERKWIGSFVAVVALASTVGAAMHTKILASGNNGITKPATESNIESNTVSSPSISLDSSRMIVISTMDGKVSALDENKGTLMWSIDAGLGPLLSSSITKLQINQDGKTIRLIPSLSGQLFKFDGDSVEALPFNAEQLLSSSFKISDGSILVGDNEVTSFGIDAATGRVVYFCRATGCDYLTRATPESRIIVIVRHQKLVRSVDVRSGEEKWNFSVGKISLDISEGVSNQLIPVSKNFEFVEDLNKGKNDFTGSGAEYAETKDETVSNDMCKKGKTKISVPDGIVSTYTFASGFRQSWKYQFSSPIASAWSISQNHVCKVDLFDPETVPALQDKGKNTNKEDSTIYLGFYQEHAYIQVPAVHNKKSRSALSVANPLYRHKTEIYPLRYSLHPYTATSNRLTEDVVRKAKEGGIAIYGLSDTRTSHSDQWGVSVDTAKGKTTEIGYYFKSGASYYDPLPITGRKKKGTNIGAGDESFMNFSADAVYPNFLYWWKEMLFVSVMTLFILIMMRKIMDLGETKLEPIRNQSESAQAKGYLEPTVPFAAEPAVFQSRYFLDFEPVRCLGKGGFGIVLESRHKVDGRTYAIKRIRLPSKESARHKVLREVRALAKLNHQCIVRYFNAWIEEPPSGWQERMDKNFIENSCHFLSTPSIDSTHITSEEMQGMQHAQKSYSKVHVPFVASESTDTAEAFSEGTQPFSIALGSAEDGSGWFSQAFPDGSSHCSFPPSSADVSGYSEDDNIPFRRYGLKEDSLSIIFQKPDAQHSTDSAIEEDGFDKRHDHSHCHKHSLASSLKKDSSGKKKQTDSEKEKSESNSSSVKAQESHLKKVDVKIFLYIQMELCQRESLHTWLTSNQDRNDKFCLRLFKQVLSAVEYIHNCLLIHRDLKPSNIFFSADGLIKVGDFGLVTASSDLCNQEIDIHESFANDCAEDKNSHTEKVGTRLYMAPEQMHGRSYDQKVDIFALGLILIELFTTFSTQMERINTLMQSRDGIICKTFEGVYNNEADLAKRMLSRKPCDRPTASEALRDEIFQ